MDLQNSKFLGATFRVNGVTYQADEAGIIRDVPAETATRLLSGVDGAWKVLVERKPVASVPVAPAVEAQVEIPKEEKEEVVETKKPKGKRS